MAFYGNNVGIVPLTDAAGITQGFKKGSHYGIDIGWYKEKYCSVLAWQKGKVIARGYTWDCGNYVCLEHSYSDNKHRWTCYIHLKETACVSVGQTVELGQKIGVRGSTGKSTAPHLHFYLTEEFSAKLPFSWSNLKAKAINPVPYLYYDKKYNTIYISPTSWKKPLPDPIDEVVKPVEKNVTKDQIICHEDNLRVRTTPSLSGTKIGHLEKDKYYDYFQIKDADNYIWYKIHDNQWVAGIDALEVLPGMEVIDPVERDENKDQLICHVSNLRVRVSNSLKADVIGFLQKDKYYDYSEVQDADGYSWYRIGVLQWVAKIEELEILPKEKFYVVEKGDTLQSIALKCSISLDELLNLNPDLIKVGDKLRIK